MRLARHSSGGGVSDKVDTHGVFRVVPIKPPTVPDSKLFRISVALSYPPRRISHATWSISPGRTVGLGNKALTWKIAPKYPPFHQKCLQNVDSIPE